MKTLWDKKAVKAEAEKKPEGNWFFRFTAEEDQALDRALVPYDIMVNLAQARMLHKSGVYGDNGLKKVLSALFMAWDHWTEGTFDLGPDDEDVHSAVEKYLTEQAGEDGARIHAGRSRNDQVLADMRLYLKDMSAAVAAEWLDIARCLEEIARKSAGVFFAGMTHTQPAMPHSADAWCAGYLDMLLSDLKSLQAAAVALDRSPLGSAAGYGVPGIPVDREFLAEQLGFREVQTAVAAAQLSRGRLEMQWVDALFYGVHTFNRMASDVIFFMHPSLGLVTLSEDQVSGSSIMPQKRNPDAWELIRASSHELSAARSFLSGIAANLTSGYHRDLQLIKKSVMSAADRSLRVAEAVKHALSGLEFSRDGAQKSLCSEIYATHRANELVLGGVPFREAYRMTAGELEEAREINPGESSQVYKHSGAPGSGIPDSLVRNLEEIEKWFDSEMKNGELVLLELLKWPSGLEHTQ